MDSDWEFAPHYFTADGWRMHYVDEGTGPPVVFVHGTPTWSYLWRHLLRGLSGSHRCIAVDHLGFGLSDKPPEADYTPAAHAERLGQVLEQLDVHDVTLVVHDYGGPIGLAWALSNLARVRRIVLMNTWLWSNEGNRAVESAHRLLSGPLGRFVYTRLNLSVRVLLPNAFADRTVLTQQVSRHYRQPFSSPQERIAPWVLARELINSNGWYDSLWDQRERLTPVPMLILWGTADRLIGPAQLQRWRDEFPHAEIMELGGVGHFVPEEAPGDALSRIREFLGS